MRKLTVLVALAAAGVAHPAAAQRLAESPIHWPPPPDTARVQYVGSLASEADIGRRESFWSKLKRTLIRGRSTQPYVNIERPFDVYVDAGDRFYVTNGLLRAVVRFDRTTSRATMLGEDVPGGLGKPMGLGGDSSGHVYVADPGLRRVVVFDRAGAFVRMFGDPRDLLNPVDVAVDSEAGRFYVVDSYAHQVVVYDGDGRVVDRLGRSVMTVAGRYHGQGAARPTKDDTTSAPHGTGDTDPSDLWDNRGSEPGEFRYPVSVDVGPDGTLYVSDQMNFRVQAFDRRGQFVRTFGGLGDRPGNLTRPKGVAVDSEGHLYVVDAAFNNVQIFNPDGDVLLAFGQLGRGDGEHWLPLGLAVDRSTDRIYVADRFNNRTQIYQYLGADITREAGTKAESRSP